MGKLLIVDDDLSNSRVLEMRLESEGYHAEVASENEATKDLAVRNEYELAIFNLRLHVLGYISKGNWTGSSIIRHIINAHGGRI